MALSRDPSRSGGLTRWIMARPDPEILSTLLDQALSLPPEARASFLDEECRHDHLLREELGSLLIAHDASSGYFERLSEQIVNPALLSLSSDVADELRVGQTFAQYRILEKLATGGMGVVFKALDQRLERFVALKFLPAPLSTDAEAKARLLAEAKAASALDHPNIGVVHDVGETAAGRLFIVMGYYEGETLERKNRYGLSIQDALSLTRQIASALAAAHQKGIVHRDVKPSNILIAPDGTAKLVDFGIAVLAGSKPVRDGAVVGTVAYMSPEQTRGLPVDHRTDLWSLGVVLYEMLTALRPFRADDEDALIRTIRHGRWGPVDRISSEMPLAITRILERCLAKDPDDRYGTAEELLTELEAVGRANSPPAVAESRGERWRSFRYRGAAAVVLCVIAAGILYVQTNRDPLLHRAVSVQTRGHRLAVLPVSLVDPQADERYLAEGMTQELIAQLSRIGGLRVIARPSVMGYRGGSKNPTEIGRELAVETVLHGSVRKAGGQLQISMHLVDALTQEQLWTQDYAAPASELQSLQREIALRVADALRVQVHSPEERQLARVGTSSADAYLLYLKGLHFLDKRTDPSVRQAKDYFEQALDLDPAFARAWTGLGDAYSALSALASLRASDAYPQSRAAAERALKIAPDLPEAHVTLATALSTYYWHFDAAADHYRRALELNPSYAHAHRLYAEYLRFEGRFDEALAAASQGAELDPLSPAHQIETGIDLYWARRVR